MAVDQEEKLPQEAREFVATEIKPEVTVERAPEAEGELEKGLKKGGDLTLAELDKLDAESDSALLEIIEDQTRVKGESIKISEEEFGIAFKQIKAELARLYPNATIKELTQNGLFEDIARKIMEPEPVEPAIVEPRGTEKEQLLFAAKLLIDNLEVIKKRLQKNGVKYWFRREFNRLSEEENKDLEILRQLPAQAQTLAEILDKGYLDKASLGKSVAYIDYKDNEVKKRGLASSAFQHGTKSSLHLLRGYVEKVSNSEETNGKVIARKFMSALRMIRDGYEPKPVDHTDITTGVPTEAGAQNSGYMRDNPKKRWKVLD